MDALLAIDQGTTGTRAVVYTLDGRIAASAYREVPQHFPRPGWVEHDALEIWATVTDTIAEATRRARRGRVRAIGITNQRETVVVWDRRTGQPLHRAIVWQDRRTAAMCAGLREAGEEPRARRLTGLVLDPYFSGSKVRWLFAHDAALRRAARRGDVAIGTIDTWLLWQLTGGATHATDMTNASRTLLFDIGRRTWSAPLLDMFDVPAGALPAVLPSAAHFGETARGATALPAGVAITGIAGDQQAALFGQGCVTPGTAKNTYGTGCFLLVNAGATRPRAPRGLLTTLACDAAGRPVYALEGAVFIAGAAIQWLRDGLGLIAQAAETEALARSVPDTGGVSLVPAFAGLSAPHWDPDARGVLTGLTRGTTRAHVVRAALEAIAHQTADMVDLATSAPGVTLRRVQVDGGASANAFLLQFQADVLGLPVVRPRSVESTALGAALLAGVGAGLGAADLRPLRGLQAAEATFRPALAPARRRDLRAHWQKAVAQTLAHGGAFAEPRAAGRRAKKGA